MIAPSSDIGDFLGDVGHSFLDDLGKVAQSTADKVRTDIADAVNTIGAGATTAAAGAIAPGKTQPVTIPLTSKQVGYVVMAAGAVLLVILLLVAGHARR